MECERGVQHPVADMAVLLLTCGRLSMPGYLSTNHRTNRQISHVEVIMVFTHIVKYEQLFHVFSIETDRSLKCHIFTF